MKRGNNALTLVGVDIEGDWNVPLLRNAAEMSGASIAFGRAALPADAGVDAATADTIEESLRPFDQVIACETGRKSRSIYALPAPRGRTAVLVGNELNGLPPGALDRANETVCIPMRGPGLTSVNVAVAGAIVLYVPERDLARSGVRESRVRQQDTDVLILDPDDPNDLGSLLRSVWAFGWRRVYLRDRHQVWFTRDRSRLTASRAAARREVNPLVVAPAEQLNAAKYNRVIRCSAERTGTALSRFTPADRGPLLIVIGEGNLPGLSGADISSVYVDYAQGRSTANSRHVGSILLSVISETLRGGGRG